MSLAIKVVAMLLVCLLILLFGSVCSADSVNLVELAGGVAYCKYAQASVWKVDPLTPYPGLEDVKGPNYYSKVDWANWSDSQTPLLAFFTGGGSYALAYQQGSASRVLGSVGGTNKILLTATHNLEVNLSGASPSLHQQGLAQSTSLLDANSVMKCSNGTKWSFEYRHTPSVSMYNILETDIDYPVTLLSEAYYSGANGTVYLYKVVATWDPEHIDEYGNNSPVWKYVVSRNTSGTWESSTVYSPKFNGMGGGKDLFFPNFWGTPAGAYTVPVNTTVVLHNAIEPAGTTGLFYSNPTDHTKSLSISHTYTGQTGQLYSKSLSLTNTAECNSWVTQ